MLNEKALIAFMEAIQEISEELETLKDYVDNHLDVAPEAVNWGNVGTARHLLELVREAGASVGLEVEEGA